MRGHIHRLNHTLPVSFELKAVADNHAINQNERLYCAECMSIRTHPRRKCQALARYCLELCAIQALGKGWRWRAAARLKRKRNRASVWYRFAHIFRLLRALGKPSAAVAIRG